VAGRSARGLPQARYLWFAVAATLFIASSWAALTQAPFPDAYAERPLFTARWWLHPREDNAPRRLPVMTGHVNDMELVGDDLWIAGTGGMVLRGRDGGTRWEQADVRSALEAAVAPSLSTPGPSPVPTPRPAPASAAMTIPASERSVPVPPFGLFAAPAYAAAASQPPQAQGPPPAAGAARSAEPRASVYSTATPPSTSDKNSAPPPAAGDLLMFEAGARVPAALQLALADPLHGCVVFDGPIVLVTANGGVSWTRARGIKEPIELKMATSQHGWAAERGGYGLTDDGGLTWSFDDWPELASGSTMHRPFFGDRAVQLHTLDFVDERTGWLVDDEGLKRTTDGGMSWRTVNQRNDFQVDFVDPRRGFAYGDPVTTAGGTLSRTDDGGASWRALPLPARTGPLTALAVVDQRRVVAMSQTGLIATDDGGDSWTSVAGWGARPAFGRPHRMVADDREIWLSDFDGRRDDLERCRDGSCRSVLGQGLDFVALGEDGRALAVNTAGRFWTSDDGGRSWGTARRLALPELTAWIGGYRQRLDLAGAGGERRWSLERSQLDALALDRAGNTWIAAIDMEGISWAAAWVAHFDVDGWAVHQLPTQAEGLSGVDARHAWALFPFGHLATTEDGGATWRPVAIPWGPGWGPPRALAFVTPQVGWVVGESGFVAVTKDGGQEWTQQQSGTIAPLRSVFFLDESQGWAGGEEGTLLVTDDGGERWRPLEVRAPGAFREPILSIQFTNSREGWLAGAGGSLLRTTDGGRTWTDQLPYRRRLPPWYFGVLAIVGALLVPALRAPRQQQGPKASVGEVLATDRPLVEGEPDVLGMREVALGISRFLRNENTLPPLTVAITGEWGTGKSSLMNLLRADLARFGFRPVVFNAWHHQKEEHLLASLLECIRSQAVPKGLTLANTSFRWRLLARRGLRYPLLLGALLLAFALSVGYALTHDHPRDDVAQLLGRAEELAIRWGLREDETAIHQQAVKPPEEVEAAHTSLLVTVLTGLGLLLSLLRGLQAFGIRPGALLARTAQAATPRALSESVGLRHQFAGEFADVTYALHPRTLTIFIDDLDRCRPQNVLDLLESVSFLVSSGDCYVVLGMAKEWVVGCVGLAFKEVAAELPPAVDAADTGSFGEATPSADVGAKRRADFARAYLEKLVNIEVPVPRATAEQSRALLTSLPRPDAASALAMGSGLRGLSVLVAAVVLLMGGLIVGGRLAPERARPDAVPAGAAATAPGDERAAAGGPSAKPNPPRVAGVSRPEGGSFLPGASSRRSFPWLFVLGAAIAALGGWRLAQRPEIVVRDSAEFTEALGELYPALARKLSTPRRVKRFMNRLRYYAMRQRALEPPPTIWDRLRHRWRGGQGTSRGAGFAGEALAEMELVLLATLHETAPALLNRGPDGFSPELRVAELVDRGFPKEIANRLAWQWPGPKSIASFQRLTESVSVR
jgi:photosystem II stability/assembly factor-like uncharacterized protein